MLSILSRSLALALLVSMGSISFAEVGVGVGVNTGAETETEANESALEANATSAISGEVFVAGTSTSDTGSETTVGVEALILT